MFNNISKLYKKLVCIFNYKTYILDYIQYYCTLSSFLKCKNTSFCFESAKMNQHFFFCSFWKQKSSIISLRIQEDVAFSFKQLDNDLSFPIMNLLLIFTPRSRFSRNSTGAKAFQFKLPPLLRLGMKPFVMMTSNLWESNFNAFIAYELGVYNFLLLKALASYEVTIHL